jgi:hypothetical protein
MNKYLSTVKSRLQYDGYRITDEILYKNQNFICTAKRLRFQLEHFGLSHTFFIFSEIPIINTVNIKEYSAKCFEYARKSRLIPFKYIPYIPYDMAVCFAVALVDQVNDEVIESVKHDEPPRHWEGYELPVICDVSIGCIYYYTDTPNWAMLLWDSFRNDIRRILTP